MWKKTYGGVANLGFFSFSFALVSDPPKVTINLTRA
jgi:hypothetical protein